jgi:hypothetical protein
MFFKCLIFLGAQIISILEEDLFDQCEWLEYISLTKRNNLLPQAGISEIHAIIQPLWQWEKGNCCYMVWFNLYLNAQWGGFLCCVETKIWEEHKHPCFNT